MEVSMGKSSIDGGFSIKPCLITEGYVLFYINIYLLNVDHPRVSPGGLTGTSNAEAFG